MLWTSNLKNLIVDSRELLQKIAQILDHRGSAGKELPLEQIVELLYQKRRYSSIGIYAVIGQEPGRSYVPLAYRGPVLPCLEVAMGKSRVDSVARSGRPVVSQLHLQFEHTGSKVFGEVAVPIKLVSRVIGVIDVESDRIAGLGYHEQVLLKQVAFLLARYLTSNGRAVIQKLRMQPRSNAGFETSDRTAETEKKAAPAPDRALSSRKAVAGDTLHA